MSLELGRGVRPGVFNDLRFFAGSAMSLRGQENFARVSLPTGVTVKLDNRKLWQQFHAETTEMIITKLGRRMFPFAQVTIGGLEPHVRYQVLLEVVPASPRRQKYVNHEEKSGKCGGWTAAGTAEAQSPLQRRMYLHPDGPATGKHWMQQPVSFAKLKLTNNSVDHHNNIVLTSMHKYVPRIWIIQSDGFSGLSHQPSACFVFEETEFIAVTAYQNENITKLKINNNPFAKGFREMGHYRWKRKHDEEDGPETPDPPKTEEKPAKVEVKQQNSENVASNRPLRLHRPWTASPPPPQPQRNSSVPFFHQINSNFLSFREISLSHFNFSANFHSNNFFPPQKFHR